jgi:hypothetical protein
MWEITYSYGQPALWASYVIRFIYKSESLLYHITFRSDREELLRAWYASVAVFEFSDSRVKHTKDCVVDSDSNRWPGRCNASPGWRCRVDRNSSYFTSCPVLPVLRFLAGESIQPLVQLDLRDACRILFNISRYSNRVRLSIQIGQRVPFHLGGFVQLHFTVRVTAGGDPIGPSLLDAATEIPPPG